MRAFLVLAVVLGVSSAQICQPRDLYIMRHTERFQQGITGAGVVDATLTNFGRNNASALADYLNDRRDQIPIQVIFVTTTTYEYQTATPYAQVTGLPVISYASGNAQTLNFDLRRKLDNLDPCPNWVLIVNHGNLFTEVFRTVGFTGDTDFSQAPFNTFNRLYHLHVEDGVDTLETIFFGDQSSAADVEVPCIFARQQPQFKELEEPKPKALVKASIARDSSFECNPIDIYATRHTERFQTGITLPPDFKDAVLTTNGRINSTNLRDFIIQRNLPIETIFATQTAYSYQTAMPFAFSTGLPIISYDLGITNSDLENFDLREKLNALDPCPETILIISHSMVLFSALKTVGYTGDIDFSLEPFNNFNRLYHLHVDDPAVGNPEIDLDIYGEQGFFQDIELPCTVVPSP